MKKDRKIFMLLGKMMQKKQPPRFRGTLNGGCFMGMLYKVFTLYQYLSEPKELEYPV